MASWASLQIATDQDLGSYEPEATDPNAPWGATTWSSQRLVAKRDLKVWLEIAYPDVPGVADRVIDLWPASYVFGYTGSAYSDYTTAAKNDTESDINLAAVFTTPSTDFLYVGSAWSADGLYVQVLDNANTTPATVTVAYWNGSSWASLDVTDGTVASTGLSFSGSGRMTWNQPTDWVRRRFNGTGDEFYWLRLRVNSTLSSGTTATQILSVRAPDGLKTVAAYLSLSYVMKGLAAQSANTQSWLERAKDYEERARSRFDLLKESGQLPIDRDPFNQVIEPATEQGSAAIKTVSLYRG